MAMARVFDGNGFASVIERKIMNRLVELEKPSLNLHTIFIGNNAGSEVYIRMKERSLERISGSITVHRFSENTPRDTVISKIRELNDDADVHGIMIELPLPTGWDSYTLLSEISEEKDVDAQNPVNVGRILKGNPLFVPPTPMAVMLILKESGIQLKGAETCIVNHSASIGRPLAMLLLDENATVHICHVFTKDMGRYSRDSDVIISAAGVPGLIKSETVKRGAIVVDVGMNRVNGKVMGDVDFNSVKEKASFITPVPGGVGPVTRYTLLSNLLKAYEMRK